MKATPGVFALLPLFAACAHLASGATSGSLPLYSGSRYLARVPDTLDLAERCGLAVHCLTESVDPDQDYQQYFFVGVGEQPIHMAHVPGEGCTPKFIEALPMLRAASGNMMNPKCEQQWINRTLTEVGVGSMNGRLLGAAGLYYKLTGDTRFKQAGIRSVDAIQKTVKMEGDAAYYPIANWVPGSDPNEKPKADFDTMIWVGDGLMRFYRCTGYKPALELAGQMARAMMKPDCFYYHPDGSFCDAALMWPGVKNKQHFHINTLERLTVLEYAAEAGDQPMLNWVAKGFEYGRSHCESTTGWCCEALRSGTHCHPMSEACAVADMVELAIRLSQAGGGDYWDDADRWVRNALAEAQLQDSAWGDRFTKSPEGRAWSMCDAAGRKAGESAEDALRKKFPAGFCTNSVLERNIGGFGGWVGMNDWFGGFGYSDGPAIMHCCTGNGSRALYCAYNAILNHQDTTGALKVNLLLNRSSKWGDVDSFLPYEGRVRVKIKQAVALSVRIPGWVDLKRVSVKVKGKPRAASFDGRYANIGSLVKGEVATIDFPISESVVAARLLMTNDVIPPTHYDYLLTMRGNTVVKIEPEGRFFPLYQREKYRSAKPRFRTVERYVCDLDLGW